MKKTIFQNLKNFLGCFLISLTLNVGSIKADEKNQIKVGSCYSDQQRAFLAVELDIYRRVLMVKVLIADPYCIAVLCIYTSAGESLCGPYLL